MPRLSISLKRAVISLHRWLGVALCLIFLTWFASGVVMMYFDFPEVRPQDRMERSPSLDATEIRVSPAEAFSKGGTAGAPAQVRLIMYGGRPLYIFGTGHEAKRVYADSGDAPAVVTREFAGRIASAWVAQPVAQAAEVIERPDQWTVQDSLRSERPLWKFSWPKGEQVYVSGVTGEVAQYTTRASRFWAYLGPIPHWMYFLPLRRHSVEWARTVTWVSGTGAVLAILGMVVGLWMFRFKKGVPGIPYRGQKRWHMTLGLTFGITAATWAFSGMLSMDPFRTQDQKVDDPLRTPLDVSAFDAKSPSQALRELAGVEVTQLELVSVAGEHAYLATSRPPDTWIVPVHGTPRRTVGRDLILRALESALPAGTIDEIRQMNNYDAYYLDRRHKLPLPVILVKLKDRDETRYYIDPKTARLAGQYSSRAWATRWLYHAPHSFDFPWLYNHRPLWDIVVIALLSGGIALSITSILQAWGAIRRKAYQAFSGSYRKLPARQ